MYIFKSDFPLGIICMVDCFAIIVIMLRPRGFTRNICYPGSLGADAFTFSCQRNFVGWYLRSPSFQELLNMFV